MDLSGNGNMLLAGIICAFLTLFQIYPKTTIILKLSQSILRNN